LVQETLQSFCPLVLVILVKNERVEVPCTVTLVCYTDHPSILIILLSWWKILDSLMHSNEITPEWVMSRVATGKQFILVLLKAGIPGPADKDEATRIQMQHLTYLFEMESAGEISIFGPVMNDPVLEGILIFNTTDKKKVSTLLDVDPHIKAGHLIYEMHDFFTLPGQQIP